jgi:hypothetical protein
MCDLVLFFAACSANNRVLVYFNAGMIIWVNSAGSADLHHRYVWMHPTSKNPTAGQIILVRNSNTVPVLLNFANDQTVAAGAVKLFVYFTGLGWKPLF